MNRRIVYDATILAGGFKSGIFFVAWHILVEWARRRGGQNICLYFQQTCTPENVEKLMKELEAEGLRLRVFAEDGMPACKRGVQRLYDWSNWRIDTCRAHVLGFFTAVPFRLIRKSCHCILRILSNAGLEKDDVFFSPLFAIPEEFRREPARKAVVLYDMMPTLFPQFYPPLTGSWYEEMLNSLNETDLYFPISKCTKKDFQAHYPHAANMEVIPLAADTGKFRPVHDAGERARVLAKYGLSPDVPFVLSLCSIDPRKNLILTAESFLEFARRYDCPNLDLVLVGGSYEKLHDPVRARLEELTREHKSIKMTGYVPDEDVAALYSAAEIFTYVSIYEGFGLPPLEAMQCGTPVITSNNSSLPEVVGDAAIMVDPGDREALIAALHKLHFDDDVRSHYRAKGLARARQFSWGRTVDVIERALTERL